MSYIVSAESLGHDAASALGIALFARPAFSPRLLTSRALWFCRINVPWEALLQLWCAWDVAGANKNGNLVQPNALFDLYEPDSLRFVPRFEYPNEL